jgi:hypothetical protein
MCGKRALCLRDTVWRYIGGRNFGSLDQASPWSGCWHRRHQLESVFTSLGLIWNTLSKEYRDASLIICCIWTRVCSDGCVVESGYDGLIAGILYVPLRILLVADTHQGTRELLSFHQHETFLSLSRPLYGKRGGPTIPDLLISIHLSRLIGKLDTRIQRASGR